MSSRNMMESSLSTQKDFKKWLVFNESLKNPDNLYHLYKSLSNNEEIGAFQLQREISEGESKIQIIQKGYNEILEIDFEQKNELLIFVKENYFPDKEVEQWYQEKKQQLNDNDAQAVYDREYEEENYDYSTIKPHSKEVFYKNFKIAISLIFYIALIAFLAIEGKEAIFVVGIFIVAFGLTFFLIKLTQEALLAGWIRGNFVRISEAQYKEVYKIVSEQSGQLKINVPKVYVVKGGFNASIAKLVGKKYLIIESEVLETFLGGNDHVIRFVIGHGLAHIKRKHLSWNWWLFPSLIIPFLPQAHARGEKLTCDRIGYHFSKRGAVNGLMIMTVGKEIVANVKAEQFLRDSVEEGGFWYSFSEKFMFYPHLANRMEQIRSYDSLRS